MYLRLLSICVFEKVELNTLYDGVLALFAQYQVVELPAGVQLSENLNLEFVSCKYFRVQLFLKRE